MNFISTVCCNIELFQQKLFYSDFNKTSLLDEAAD